MKEPVKAVIFDLDHTLVRSGIDFPEMKIKIVDYLEKRLPSLEGLDGNRPTYEMTQAVVENLQSRRLSNIIPEVTEDINRMMNATEMKYVSKATLIEGAVETLKRLKSVGMKIGILTRACRQYTEKVLAATGLSEFVDEVATRDDSANPKPDPSQIYWLIERMKVSSHEVVMVGDHPVDALCARNAGIAFVGVLTGSWREEQTKQLGSTVIRSVKELPDLLGIRGQRERSL